MKRFDGIVWTYTCILIQLALSCTACGDEEKVYIDPELQPMLDLYLAAAPDDGKFDELMSLEFGEPPSKDLTGNCEVENVESQIFGQTFETRTVRRIVIRRRKMDTRLEAIVLHELGHCLHDLEHVDDPKALMAEKIVGSDEYWRDQLEAKLKEAFE